MDQKSSQPHEMEGEVYFPAPEIVTQANVSEYENLYQRSIEDPEMFWAERA